MEELVNEKIALASENILATITELIDVHTTCVININDGRRTVISTAARKVDPELAKYLEESACDMMGYHMNEMIPLLDELANTGMISTMELSPYWNREGSAPAICALKHNRLRKVLLGIMNPGTAAMDALKESHSLTVIPFSEITFTFAPEFIKSFKMSMLPLMHASISARYS